MEFPLSRPSLRSTLYRRLADITLVAGILLSVYGWQHAASTLREGDNEVFEALAAAKTARVTEHLERYLDLCAGLSALFHASENVTREEFHEHFRSLRTQDRFGALQALQYSVRVPAAARPAFEAAMSVELRQRLPGHAEFRIHPQGERKEYWPVVYNEPVDGNEASFGRDLAAEPQWQSVLASMRDTGRPTISAPVPLRQDQGAPIGFVIRSAVYGSGVRKGAGEAPQGGMKGFVSAVLRATDLMRLALDDHDASRYHIRISDIGDAHFVVGDARERAVPLFDAALAWSHAYVPPATVDPGDRRIHVKAVAGRMWEVAVTRRPVNYLTQAYPFSILFGTLAATLALWVVLRVFFERYSRATALANDLTRQAKESEARLRNVIDGTVDGILTLNREGRIMGVNAAAVRMFGHEEAGMLGRNASLLMPLDHAAPDSGSSHGGQACAPCALAAGVTREVTGLRRDGTLFPLELSVSEVELDGARHFVAMLRDISERRATELAIEESQRKLRRADALRRTIYDSAPFAIVAIDLRGVIQAMNPAAETLLGYSADELVGRATPALYHDRQELALRAAQLTAELGEPVEVGIEALIARARTGRPDEREWTCIRKGGERMPMVLVMTSMTGENGEPVGYLGISYDVTERKRAEEHIRHMAHHDALTSLPNRLLLQERLSAALTRAHREEECVALMFIDLDRFKNINDSLGHHVGDAILKVVAERLHAAVRASDTVARMGGDEFVVLLPKVTQLADCELVARKMIGILGEPMQVGPHLLRVTPSIGLATYPEAGSDPATLMRAADAAMYHAKAQGRNSFRLYNESMTRDSADRLRMENDLHEALSRGELRVLYQPQFDCATGRLVGAEALLRWHRRGGAMVLPSDFIPMAEDNGLIVPIGAWVLREACAQARRWQDSTGAALRVAVNLSPRQIESDELLRTVDEALHASGLGASRLELEITESAIVRDTLSTATVLARLRSLGISIAIDDFGIGYSSMAYLRELPVDKFKIDRAFLAAVPASVSDTRLAAALIAMGHTLQVGLVAEGVETQEQLDFLRANGCHEAQGHYLGRPVSAEEFEALFLVQSPPAAVESAARV